MLTASDIAALLTDLQNELAAKSAQLVPWFAANRPRIETLTKIISRLESSIDPGRGLKEAATLALDQARRLVVENYPAQQQWFDSNAILLRLIALRIFAAQDAKESQARELRTGSAESDQLDKSLLIAATVEPLFLPTDPPPDFLMAVGELTGRSDRITAFLQANGFESEPAADQGGGTAAELANLNEGMLKSVLQERIEVLRIRQNREIERAARLINELNNTEPKFSPSTATLRLPATLNQAEIREELSKQAANSAEAVAGLVVFVRAFRPTLRQPLEDALAAHGTLDGSWTFANIRGEKLAVRHLDTAVARILLGAKLAENLRVVAAGLEDAAAPTAARAALVVGSDNDPPDLLTPAKRTEANLAAHFPHARNISIGGRRWRDQSREILAGNKTGCTLLACLTSGESSGAGYGLLSSLAAEDAMRWIGICGLREGSVGAAPVSTEIDDFRE